MRGDAFFVELAARPPFTRLAPGMAAFFKDYLAREKVIRFRDQYVVNTNFPPYPSAAFDNLVEQFGQLGETRDRRLYSVTWAVTNRCEYRCWHCYNAGRSQEDLGMASLRKVARELRGFSAVMVTLTGGEPLLRNDLEAIAGLFDERSCLILGTAYYEAIDPAKRAGLSQEFLEILRDRHRNHGEYQVVHDYVAGIARRPKQPGVRSQKTEVRSQKSEAYRRPGAGAGM